MKEGAYLSEVVRKEQFQKGTMSLICAKTGQGKTTMATRTLPTLLEVSSLSRVLFLIDTNMGQEQLVKEGPFQEWGEKQKDKIYLMNYHKFGKLLKNYEIWSEMFDLIIADEFHNLYKYAKIDQAKMYKNNPDFTPETIAFMLSRESASYKAMEVLKRWSQNSNAYVVAMTATPQQFETDKELTDYINVVEYNEKLIAYEILQKYFYTNPAELFSQNPDCKRLIFVQSIKQAREFQKMIEATGRKVVVLHSLHNDKYKMSEEALMVRQHLISEQCLPSWVQDAILTEAYVTGWNLIDPTVQILICHIGNQIVIQQAIGRPRQDIQQLYLYDAKKADDEKRTKRNNKEVDEKEWNVPEEYLGIPLDKNKKEALIQKMNFPKKWTSLKKALLQNGYNVEEKRTAKERCSIIRKA